MFTITQPSNWLLSLEPGEILNRIKINTEEYLRLNMPGDFQFPEDKVKELRDAYNSALEKGGLILFKPSFKNGLTNFIVDRIIFVTNDSEIPNEQYRANPEELRAAYLEAFKSESIPLFFHTHPTLYSDSDDIIKEGLNYLDQLNTSVQDQAITRKTFTYNGHKLRLPEILIVENANAMFIGIYGGLISPICFTQQKDKAFEAGMHKTLNGIKDWANTPERQAVVFASAFAILILGIGYIRYTIPLVNGLRPTLTPMLYANQDRYDFFGITYGRALTIHVPRIDDAEINEIEAKAIEAQKEARRIAEAKQKATV